MLDVVPREQHRRAEWRIRERRWAELGAAMHRGSPFVPPVAPAVRALERALELLMDLAAELDAAQRGAEKERAWLGYAGQLGAALILSRFAVAGLAGTRQLVVGFDSGDHVVLGT